MFILLFVFTSVNAIDESICIKKNKSSYSEDTFEKLYVQPEEVLINENGIFFISDETIFRISSLHHDAQGIYFLKSPDYALICPKGHEISCMACMGCEGWAVSCPYRCRCLMVWKEVIFLPNRTF